MCPDIVDINGYVFIADFFDSVGAKTTTEREAINKLERLIAQHNNDKKKVEQWVNSWSFGDFFIGKYSKSMENDKILLQFGDVIVNNWSRRVKEVFPDRNIIVEYGDAIMGEEGLTITLYEA